MTSSVSPGTGGATQSGGPGGAVSSDPVLRCEGLRKRFGARQAVDGISFEIARGETYGLLGPNGAGKTTTISMVCGILARDGGTVVVDGQPLDVGTTSAKAAIGLVPQDLAIYPDLTARENLVFFGRLYGLGGRALAARVDEVLDVVDLADRAKERTEHYSGGMKRRLNIAVGLLHRPRLLVLDEPTVGVDPQSRNAILSSVEALSARGHGHPLHDPLHGGGRAPLRPRRDHRRGQDHRRGDPAGARRARRRGSTRSAWRRPETSGRRQRRFATIDGVREVTPHDGGLDLLVVEARRLLPRILEAVVA